MSAQTSEPVAATVTAAIPADVVERLREALAARPKYAAIPIDVADIRAILAAVDSDGAQ